MSFSVYHIATDISDYTTSVDSAPFLSRNRDYSLRIETVNLQVAGSYSTDIVADDLIKIYDDSKILFCGYVERSVYNHNNQTWEVTVLGSLSLLSQTKVQHSSLHSLFNVTGVEWYQYTTYGSCYYGFPVVGLTWLLAKVFSACSLTLDTTAIDDINLMIMNATSAGDFDGANTSYAKFKHLFVREDLLYSCGQTYVADSDTIDADEDYKYNKISCFELVSEICQRLGLLIIITDVDTYKVMVSTDTNTSGVSPNLTISDDKSYSKREEDLRGYDISGDEGVGYTDSYTKKRVWSDAVTPVEYETVTAGIGVSKTDSFINNLEILVSDAYDLVNHYTGEFAYCRLGVEVSADTTANNDVIIVKGGTVDFDPTTYTQASYPLWNQYRYIYRNKFSDYTRIESECPYDTSDLALLENFIDLERRTSQIIQETY